MDSGDSGTKRGTSVGLGTLYVRRGEHVTRSFCPSSCPAPSPSPSDGSKNLRSDGNQPAQVGPPTRLELSPGHASLIFDREALRAFAR